MKPWMENIRKGLSLIGAGLRGMFTGTSAPARPASAMSSAEFDAFLQEEDARREFKGPKTVAEQRRVVEYLRERSDEVLTALFEEYPRPWLRRMLVDRFRALPKDRLGKVYDDTGSRTLKEELVWALAPRCKDMPPVRLASMFSLAPVQSLREKIFKAMGTHRDVSELGRDALVERLGRPSEALADRCCAAAALSETGAEGLAESLGDIIAELEAEPLLVRVAILSLWKTGTDAAADRLMDMFDDERDIVREAVADIVGRSAWRERAASLKKKGTAKAYQSLVRMLRNDQLRVSEAAAEVLLTSEEEGALEHLSRALRDHRSIEDAIRIMEVVLYLEERRGGDPEPGSKRALMELLVRYPTGCVGARAAEALGDLRIREALRPLLEALTSYDPTIRWKAASALGRLGLKEALEPLKDAAANDESPLVRKAAKESLEALGKS